MWWWSIGVFIKCDCDNFFYHCCHCHLFSPLEIFNNQQKNKKQKAWTHFTLSFSQYKNKIFTPLFFFNLFSTAQATSPTRPTNLTFHLHHLYKYISSIDTLFNYKHVTTIDIFSYKEQTNFNKIIISPTLNLKPPVELLISR